MIWRLCHKNIDVKNRILERIFPNAVLSLKMFSIKLPISINSTIETYYHSAAYIHHCQPQCNRWNPSRRSPVRDICEILTGTRPRLCHILPIHAPGRFSAPSILYYERHSCWLSASLYPCMYIPTRRSKLCMIFCRHENLSWRANQRKLSHLSFPTELHSRQPV